jgi:D-alanine-D-alanine ligase
MTVTPKKFGRVAVLMGGASSEREVSLDSGRNVLAALHQRGVDAHAVDGIPALIEALIAKRCDRVFNVMHGQRGGGEDGVVQGVLDAFGIPYTGSGVLGAALAMDKIRTKQVWLALGLPTPRYVRLERGGDVNAAARELGLPVIVKPASEGSSVGISRVFDAADLPRAVELAARYPGELLMEQLIEGDEYTVSILGDEALPSIRIVPAGAYYDYRAKYVADDTQYICPGLTGTAEGEMCALALEAFRTVGCSGWGRVDLMRQGHSQSYSQSYSDKDSHKNGSVNFLLEVNTVPGMTSHSLVPKAAAARGLEFEELVWRILAMSLGSRVGESR